MAANPLQLSPSQVSQNQQMLCKFHMSGKCVRGRSCSFQHDPAQVPVCVYHVEGNCKYGKDCAFVHGDICPNCSKPCLHPFNKEMQQKHKSLCAGEDKQNQGIQCGICFEIVHQQRFGLLTGCEHAFCLPCIRQWRGTKSLEEKIVRSCPSCRKLTHFVVPSERFVVGAEKVKVLEEYKARLKRIPCKYFLQHNDCPFRFNCFYAHVHADGTHGRLPRQSRFRPRHPMSLVLSSAENDPVAYVLEQMGIDASGVPVLDLLPLLLAAIEFSDEVASDEEHLMSPHEDGLESPLIGPALPHHLDFSDGPSEGHSDSDDDW